MRYRPITTVMTYAIFVILLTGCAQPFGVMQIGCLPRPGIFTLFTLSDTNEIIEDGPTIGLNPQMVPLRGIVYTKRAGFVDMAHVHNTTLLATRFSGIIEVALRQRKELVQLDPFDDSLIRVFLPAERSEPSSQFLTEGTRSKSRRIGECVALDLMAWHEIVTWFNYQTTNLWTEKPSAFTYEDIVSHFVGAQVFESISGDINKRTYALALRQVLQRLRIVRKELAADAINRVEGLWWGPNLYTRRLVDTGGRDATITPWLVPGNDPELHEGSAIILASPCAGPQRDFTLNITPSDRLRALLRKSAPSLPQNLNSDQLFPMLVEIIRIEVQSEFGENAIRPD